MSKARATCTCATCGSTFEVTTIKRNTSEAAAWEAWAVRSIVECPECKRVRIEAARAEENAQAAAEASEAGLPELQGSEKQVAWANTIRKQILDPWMAAIREAEAITALSEKQQEALRRAKDGYAWAAGQVSASWWIDNRYNTWKQVAREYMAKIAKQ